MQTIEIGSKWRSRDGSVLATVMEATATKVYWACEGLDHGGVSRMASWEANFERVPDEKPSGLDSPLALWSQACLDGSARVTPNCWGKPCSSIGYCERCDFFSVHRDLKPQNLRPSAPKTLTREERVWEKMQDRVSRQVEALTRDELLTFAMSLMPAHASEERWRRAMVAVIEGGHDPHLRDEPDGLEALRGIDARAVIERHAFSLAVYAQPASGEWWR